MKKILLSIVALCCTVVAGAQNSSQQQTAILQKGDGTAEGSVTVYYGSDALKEAYNAADEEGCVITLTSGQFNFSMDIKKAIAIYGVGFEDGLFEGVQKTTINGWVAFRAFANGSNLKNAKLEGVYVNNSVYVNHCENLTIAKCQFSDLVFDGTDITGVLVRQCYISGSVNGKNNVIGGLTVKNCYFGGWVYDTANNSQMTFDHCIFVDGKYSHSNYPAFYTNCIIQHSWGDNDNLTGLRYGSTAEKCIFARGAFSSNVFSVDNWFGVDFSTLFEDATNSGYTAERTFELAAPDTYKGTDGTPVGVTGGDYPWYKVPSIPYVKNLNATVNGTNLDVNYEAGVGSTNPPTN